MRKATKAATQGQIHEVIYSWVGRESGSVGKNVWQPELGSHSVCKEITLRTEGCTSSLIKMTDIEMKYMQHSKNIANFSINKKHIRSTLRHWAARIRGLTSPYKCSCPLLAFVILCVFFLFCCSVSSRRLPQQRCRIAGNFCNKMYSILPQHVSIYNRRQRKEPLTYRKWKVWEYSGSHRHRSACMWHYFWNLTSLPAAAVSIFPGYTVLSPH